MKIILTGSTGMVGEGVLHECLIHQDVQQILVINRKPCGIKHPKLVEIIHSDFFNLSPIEFQLKNYDACFFCLGVSSVGMKEDDYTRLTYDLTLNFARTLAGLNPQMVFNYVSGASTDSTEKGKSMWARVKGKTENDLMKLPFKKVYAFRPGYIQPTSGLQNAKKFYFVFSWLYPFLRRAFPKFVSSLKEIGLAMINSVNSNYPKNILEVTDIKVLAYKA